MAKIREVPWKMSDQRFIKRATFRSFARIQDPEGWWWELARQDSITGGRDLIAIVTTCPRCGDMVGDHAPETEVPCGRCNIKIIVPPAIAERAREADRRLAEAAWEIRGGLFIPDC